MGYLSTGKQQRSVEELRMRTADLKAELEDQV
jgi:hypothetical protein